MQAKAKKLLSLLERATQCHQAGDLLAARRLYTDILKASPNQFDALHYLGLLEAQSARHAEAISCIQQALSVNPQSAEANSNLGCVFLETGDHENALACFDRALALQADHLEAFFNRGNALRGLKRHDAALRSYDAALRIHPRYFPALINKGTLLQEVGRYQEAISSLESALAVKADEPGIYLNLGLVERKLQHYEKALAYYDQALAINPGYADALYNRGNVLRDLDRNEEALEIYDRALAIKPDHIEALYNRGNALLDLGRHEDALISYDRALALKPDHAEAFGNRGTTLLGLDLYEDALASYDRALAVKPDYADALSNRGNALLNLKRYHEALESFGQAIALRPDYAEAHLNEGVCRLMLGDFEKGWEHYEWRWKAKKQKPSERSFPQPLWDGKFVDGVLLAWAEQGLGDQILHAGMVNELRRHATHLVIDTKPRLVELFRRSFPGIEIIAQGEQPRGGHIDMQVPMGSVGQYLRRRWEDFPARETGYLIADAARARDLRERLTGDGRFVLGLSWASKARYYSEQKSARLRDFEPILKLPGIRFVDLQYGDTLEERTAVKESTGVDICRLEDVDNYQDIDGLAALITACDAVVTVSNTTAHVAGALGKKVFLLLPYSQGSLWYWHADRDDSPWYPAAKLFRQPAIGDWSSVIRQVTEELVR